MINLRATASPVNVLAALKDLRLQLSNIQGGATSPAEWRRQYISWTNNALDSLRPCLREADVDRLVTSRHYWALLGMDVLGAEPKADRHVQSIIRTEVKDRLAELDSVIKTLQGDLDAWRTLQMPIVAVLDTNILLEHHDHLDAYQWNEELDVRPNRDVVLVVPIAVVDELDRQKLSNQKASDGKTPLRTRARAALKTLDNLLLSNETVKLVEGKVAASRSAVFIRLLYDDLGHSGLADTDSEIIDRALTLQPFADDLVLVTYDSAMAFRARHAGLRATKLTYD